MAGKRHASEEISAKLAQANELAAKGKTQREISKALGVSIMTYHRWKKMLSVSPEENSDRRPARLAEAPVSNRSSSPEADDELKRLETENARLRQLVTDMLLEKLRLDEELRAQRGAPFGRPSKGK